MAHGLHFGCLVLPALVRWISQICRTGRADCIYDGANYENRSKRLGETHLNALRFDEAYFNGGNFENMRNRLGETHSNAFYLEGTHSDGSKFDNINDGSNISPYCRVFAPLKGCTLCVSFSNKETSIFRCTGWPFRVAIFF